MSKGLIWQDDENTIDVVYQTIYGLPIREAMQVIKKYQEKQLIPVEWMKNYARKICTDDDGRYNSKAYGICRMIYDWEKENDSK